MTKSKVANPGPREPHSCYFQTIPVLLLSADY